ncbi:transcriptional regulator [Pseudohongiella sp. SYSU M77423]|uniref:P-II family nitrogen regulator n=1 Tax=Pseudohongiella sp. SYSU M77423 TaxID=3042312 RepID=UPI00247FBA8D|nr:transcriptional regulator [Pseudohongiella sp. SYSU M77423]MDH7944538.1 transcriptional regulator [Pseudohongiella sp. SYSU M77423]
MSEHSGAATRTLVTIICEAVLESRLLKDLDALGAPGWTISEARGSGSRGVRASDWDNNSNIRVEVVCGRPVAEKIMQYMQEHYYADFAMICFLSDVEVLRLHKF